MTYSKCEDWLKEKLQTIYDAGEAGYIADWVMEEYTGSNRQQRKLLSTEQVSKETLTKIEEALQQLLQHKPLQYVLGYALFYGMKFTVNESVLIPRPETEELVDWIITAYKKVEKALQILDIGTGSGCIPVSLKKHLPNALVSSVDISSAALEIAKENAVTNHVEIQFQQQNFLEESNWQQHGVYDIIVSNPPYIPFQEKAAMDKNVIAWEPDTALFVPNESPLLFYEKIASFGKTHLQPDGAIFMETHKDYATAVQKLFIEKGYKAELKKDMHGNERMVKAVFNE